MREAADTKELVARTALELFVEKGITETTIRDIAARAGIAEGTMYRHYSSKEELAWDIYWTALAEFTQELDSLRKGYPTLKEQSEAMVRRFCRFFDEDPVLCNYLLLSQHTQDRKITPDMPQPFNVVRDAVAEGMERGEISRRDPELVAAMVFGLVRSAAVSTVSGRITGSLSSAADEIVSASWRVLAGQ